MCVSMTSECLFSTRAAAAFTLSELSRSTSAIVHTVHRAHPHLWQPSIHLYVASLVSWGLHPAWWLAVPGTPRRGTLHAAGPAGPARPQTPRRPTALQTPPPCGLQAEIGTRQGEKPGFERDHAHSTVNSIALLGPLPGVHGPNRAIRSMC